MMKTRFETDAIGISEMAHSLDEVLILPMIVFIVKRWMEE